MGLVKKVSCLSLVALTATGIAACSKKKDEEPPPPPPSATVVATPPPPTVSTVVLQPEAPPVAPGQAPGTLQLAIDTTRPQMKDSSGAPDEGSNQLLKYWLMKTYPWAQLEAVPLVTAAAFVAAPDANRGKRVCGAGVVQQFTKVQPTPAQYEGVLATKEGDILSYGGVGDATGITQNGQARFCGIASGVMSMPDGKKAVRVVGYFDTPANRGGGGGQFASLKACCQALQQNSVSMPPPNNLYAANAAAYCLATVASISSPAQKDAMLAGIRGALRGVPLPGVCHLRRRRAPGGRMPGAPRRPQVGGGGGGFVGGGGGGGGGVVAEPVGFCVPGGAAVPADGVSAQPAASVPRIKTAARPMCLVMRRRYHACIGSRAGL